MRSELCTNSLGRQDIQLQPVGGTAKFAAAARLRQYLAKFAVEWWLGQQYTRMQLGMDVGLAASTFAVVFLAELPDKTALATLLLATRLPPRQVVAGAWLAFLVQTLVAVLAGSVLRLLPSQPLHIAAGIGFLVFAAVALKRDVAGEIEEERADVELGRGRRSPPWVGSFLVVFAAEWGDLTQLATAGLAAQTGQPLEVGIGALGALWVVTVIAATVGTQLTRVLSPSTLNRAGAVLLAAIGVVIIISAIRPI